MNSPFHPSKLGAVLGSLGFCLLFLGAAPGHAASASGNEASAPASARYGTVWRLRGEVTATKAGAPARKLREGDPVYVGERLRAGSEAEAVVQTLDAGVVAVRPNTEFVAERFAAEDKPSDGFTVRLLTGSLRVISGWIGQTNRAGHNVVTPSATIGIRGTDHEPYVGSSGKSYGEMR